LLSTAATAVAEEVGEDSAAVVEAAVVLVAAEAASAEVAAAEVAEASAEGAALAAAEPVVVLAAAVEALPARAGVLVDPAGIPAGIPADPAAFIQADIPVGLRLLATALPITAAGITAIGVVTGATPALIARGVGMATAAAGAGVGSAGDSPAAWPRLV
jgi:hypothetical protein